MATAAPPPAQPVQQSKITPAQTDPATGITYYGGKQYNVPGPTPQSSTTTQALPGGVRFDPATGQYRTQTGALASGGYGPSGQALAYQPPSQGRGPVGPITMQIGTPYAPGDPNAGARAVASMNAAAGPGITEVSYRDVMAGRVALPAPSTLTPSQQLQLDTLRSSGVQVMQGLTPGQIASGLSRINPDLAKVAFHPAGKEGTYSPWLLTSTGLIYKTPSGAWEEFGTGGGRTTTLEASGASGSLSAILQNPAKYLRDVQAMGLAPTSPQAKTQLGNVGALPTTITTGGSVWSFPTYSPQYQAFSLQAAGAQRNVQTLAQEAKGYGWMQGGTIVLPNTAQGADFGARYSNAVDSLNAVYSQGLASGIIAKQGDAFIPGPGQAKSEAFVISGGNIVGRSAGGQVSGSQGTPVFGALTSPFIAGSRPSTMTPVGSSSQPLTITGFKVPQPPLAGTPLAPLGAAYQGFSQWMEGLNTAGEKAILSRAPQLPAAFFVAEKFLTPVAQSFNPPVLSDIKFGGTTKIDAGGTAAQFMYEGAESIYKKPATTAISYSSMLVLPGVAEAAGSAGEAFGIPSETLASAGSIGSKVLGGVYGATVLYRVGTSPNPAREAGGITATEIIPGYAGAASYPYLKSGVQTTMGFAGQARYIMTGSPQSRLDILAQETGLSDTGAIPPSTIRSRFGEILEARQMTTMKIAPGQALTPFDTRFDAQTPSAGGERLQMENEALAQMKYEMSPASAKADAAKVFAVRDAYLQNAPPTELENAYLKGLSDKAVMQQTRTVQYESDVIARGKAGRIGTFDFVRGPEYFTSTETPWPGRAVAVQVAAPVLSYEVPSLSLERVVPSAALSSQAVAPTSTETVRLGFMPILPGQPSMLITTPATKVTTASKQVTSITPEMATISATALANDPLIGATQNLLSGQSVSQAVQVVNSNIQQASPKETFSVINLPATAQAQAAAQASSQSSSSRVGLDTMSMSSLALIPGITPFTVLQPVTITMPVTTEIPPPITPSPQLPYIPEFPALGGGFPGMPYKRRPRNFMNWSFAGIDISTFGGAHVPEFAAMFPRRRKR